MCHLSSCSAMVQRLFLLLVCYSIIVGVVFLADWQHDVAFVLPRSTGGVQVEEVANVQRVGTPTGDLAAGRLLDGTLILIALVATSYVALRLRRPQEAPEESRDHSPVLVEVEQASEAVAEVEHAVV